MGRQRERGDRPEVAAAAAQRPEQVRLVGRVRGDRATVGEHDVGGEQVVDRQPVLPRQVSVAAAEGQPPDAGGRDDAAGHAQPVRRGGTVDVGPGGAAADPHGSARRIDVDGAHRAQVRDDAAVTRAEARAAVAAAAHGDGQAVVAGEGDRRGDVAGVGTAHDQRGIAIDHAVVHGTGLVVGRVAGRHQLPAHLWPKGLAHVRLHGWAPLLLPTIGVAPLVDR